MSTKTGGGYWGDESLMLKGSQHTPGSTAQSSELHGTDVGQQRMREGCQGISGGSWVRKPRRHPSCLWVGEGGREKQTKGQKKEKIEVTGNAPKGDRGNGRN